VANNGLHAGTVLAASPWPVPMHCAPFPAVMTVRIGGAIMGEGSAWPHGAGRNIPSPGSAANSHRATWRWCLATLCSWGRPLGFTRCGPATPSRSPWTAGWPSSAGWADRALLTSPDLLGTRGRRQEHGRDHEPGADRPQLLVLACNGEAPQGDQGLPGDRGSPEPIVDLPAGRRRAGGLGGFGVHRPDVVA